MIFEKHCECPVYISQIREEGLFLVNHAKISDLRYLLRGLLEIICHSGLIITLEWQKISRRLRYLYKMYAKNQIYTRVDARNSALLRAVRSSGVNERSDSGYYGNYIIF